jgi:predicted small metal-binding protein
MKHFACGDVVPGCDARFAFTTDDEILTAVAEHARTAHGIPQVSAELAGTVRTLISAAA